ncbi:hypothetical protein EZS27_038521 [termite gut metagenome]|uniref:DUF1896 domain-containing protein n=1 Tax=termite gut metagenome TaxID=433724 RepID=A0A5J4PND5_9ZZZZ
MNSKKDAADISYFRLSLMEFLRESHPELTSNHDFIAARSEAAAESYEQAVRNGSNPVEAAETANTVLFEGLHFSKHDTLVTVLWNEFADVVPQSEAGEFALSLLPQCEPVFAKYPLWDDFAYTSEFDLLYTELTGIVSLYSEEHHGL